MATEVWYSSTGQVTGGTGSNANAYMKTDNGGSAAAVQLNASSQLLSGGGLGVIPKSYNTTHTLLPTDGVVFENALSGSYVVTLPVASVSTGITYIISKQDTSSNTIFVKGAGSDGIVTAGTSANTAYIYAAAPTLKMTCDGSYWRT